MIARMDVSFRKCFLVILLFTLFSPSSWAVTFTVNSTVDAIDANAGDGVCETLADNGICSLRAALEESNALSGADIIKLPAGTYVNSQIGVLMISSDLIIEGAGTTSTIIDGGAVDTVISTQINPDITVEIRNLVIQNGSADSGATPTSGRGCGGLAHFQGTLTLSNVIVRDNFANFIGGICNSSTMYIVNSTVSGNTTNSGGSGGIRNDGGATLYIQDSAVINNIATNIHYNSASGGGIENGGNLFLTNVTLSGNSSDSNGGALYIYGGSVALSNVTITNNTSNFGAAIGNFNSDPLTIKNSIIAKNTGAPYCNGLVSSSEYSLADVATCGFDSDGTSIINADVGLDTLKNNGGATSTHALLPASPAIDAGNPSNCTDQDDVVVITDQRNATRPVDGGTGNVRCDIGAFEYNGPIANAGLDQITNFSSLTTLDGSNSLAPAGSIIYEWTQVSGANVSLQDSTTSIPSFTAPSVAGTLEFSLTITDSNNATATDTVIITVNAPPTAIAGSAQTVNNGDTVNLDGTGSSDSDGTVATYSWSQVSGVNVALTGANTSTPSFTAPSSSDILTFQLTVTDDNGSQAVDTITVTVTNNTAAQGDGGSSSFNPILLLLLSLLVFIRLLYREKR